MKKIIVSAISCGVMAYSQAQDNRENIAEWLKTQQTRIAARVSHYDYQRHNLLTHQETQALTESNSVALQTNYTAWKADFQVKPVANRNDAVDVKVLFTCTGGSHRETSVSVVLLFDNWSKENYVLMPAAAYNGNRFDSRRIAYSPKLLDVRDVGKDKPIILTDVPRLNNAEGYSRIQGRSGDMSVPSIGFQSNATKKGFFLLTTQGNRLGDYGIDIEETRNRKGANIAITAPLVRELYKYRITDNQFPSDDKAAYFRQGDTVSITCRLYYFDAATKQDLFDKFVTIRKDVVGKTPLRQYMPFSQAYQTIHDKFNRSVSENGNWDEDLGYYTVGDRANFLQDWQIGWTGGMISTLPLITDGSETSLQRSVRMLDWLFPAGIAPSGFFWDSGERKGNEMKWYGGDIRKPISQDWHLTRKGGDGLYYVMRHFEVLKDKKIAIKPAWEQGTKTVANAFVKLWDKDGQFGNFIDTKTGEVAVGGSTSGGIVPAGLALAYRYFNDENYLRVAEAAAQYYYKNFVQQGITNGGPGDAMQNMDSESCYGLLESFTVLYDITKKPEYLKMSEELAAQFTTWVIGYDYKFPSYSTFGKLGISSLGSVFANTQNKHGAPGICTYSGIALLKLYRATGKKYYMELLQEIAHAIPQFISYPQRPIADLPFGWMSERVSTTDWLEGIGEIVRHTTWAETAMMLTYMEIPGVYVQPDKNYVVALDHVTAKIIKADKKSLTIAIKNETQADATVKLMTDKGENNLPPMQKITLKSGEVKNVTVKR